MDIKAGRQTTVLGPMGALPWQRPFASSDYAWYNLEEGRYTGVSADWHISKQLDMVQRHRDRRLGRVLRRLRSTSIDYITQINYWLDEEAKKTQGVGHRPDRPDRPLRPGNTTVVEAGFLHNYNKYVYQIVDFQCVYSKAADLRQRQRRPRPRATSSGPTTSTPTSAST